MSTQENKDLIRQYTEALSGKPKPSAIVDLYVAEQLLKDHISGFRGSMP